MSEKKRSKKPKSAAVKKDKKITKKVELKAKQKKKNIFRLVGNRFCGCFFIFNNKYLCS